MVDSSDASKEIQLALAQLYLTKGFGCYIYFATYFNWYMLWKIQPDSKLKNKGPIYTPCLHALVTRPSYSPYLLFIVPISIKSPALFPFV